MIATLPWLLPAIFPALLCAILAKRTERREPVWLVGLTFAVGTLTGLLALVVTRRAAVLTGLDMHVSTSGESGAIVFLFFVMMPTQEAAKVAAAWPAFLSKHIDQSYDGVVYAAASALAFSAVETGFLLRSDSSGGMLARALVALPAQVFFACLWGYALGRAKHSKSRVPIFPIAFVGSIIGHAVYGYFVFGRGPGALLAVSPLLAAMGVVVWILLRRDLRERELAGTFVPPSSRRWGRLTAAAQPPSLSAVRAALTRADQPLQMHWVALGALVTLGAMLAGLAAGVLAAHWLRIDLSTVDEHDVRAAAPALLLGVGLLASFPTSGWLIARAAGAHTLLEPALATGAALAVALVGLGLTAPFAVVFGLALAPIAWVLACAGAWLGRAV